MILRVSKLRSNLVRVSLFRAPVVSIACFKLDPSDCNLVTRAFPLKKGKALATRLKQLGRSYGNIAGTIAVVWIASNSIRTTGTTQAIDGNHCTLRRLGRPERSKAILEYNGLSQNSSLFLGYKNLYNKFFTRLQG